MIFLRMLLGPHAGQVVAVVLIVVVAVAAYESLRGVSHG